MKTFFTKGPWGWSDFNWDDKTTFAGRIFSKSVKYDGPYPKHYKGFTIQSGGMFGIAGKNRKQAKANLVLMAASPQLFHALEDIIIELEHGCTQAKLNRAIKKGNKALLDATTFS